MLAGLVKYGHLGDAHKLRVKMPLRNFVFFTTMIMDFSQFDCNCGDIHFANQRVQDIDIMLFNCIIIGNFFFRTVTLGVVKVGL